MTTGQKIPQMSGTMAEIQTTLMQIQTGMQTIVNNQQSLNQRLINLESSATNLTHQFQNLRLTHTKEQKQIEYGNTQNNHSSHLEEENQNY
jgi:septal ring factor EnvC (AmiA/AmiB activator)